jgi:hypothetical protein
MAVWVNAHGGWIVGIAIIGELKCQFMPPQLVLIPSSAHGAQLVTMFPTVTDKQLCAQHRFAHETANGSGEDTPEKKLIS